MAAPILAVEAAYPGMPPNATVATISNDGSEAIRYDFFVTVATSGGAQSLADIRSSSPGSLRDFYNPRPGARR